MSSAYTLAPGGDTGWRSNTGSVAVAVLKGALNMQWSEECAESALEPGKTYLIPSGQFRLLNKAKEPLELLVNFTNLPSGSPTPLVDGPSEPAPDCGFPGGAPVPHGVSASNSFRGDVSAYFQQAHAEHGGGHAGDGYATKELSVKAGLDTFMATFTLQPGFSTGWFAHTEHVAIITKGSWAFYEPRDGKCEPVEKYSAGDAWLHHVHRHLGAVQGNEPVEITLFGFNLKHGQPMPVFDSNPDHLDFTQSPPSDCPTQLR
jgi:quercetin dioxygenase-like cupin family protein